MSVHNGARYLRQAVDSILAQSFTDFELVVVDDGSDDGTGDILSSYRDGRLRVIRLSRVGLPAALNAGLRECRADLIARMDSDDIARHDRLQVEVETMVSEPTLDIVCSDVVIIDTDGSETGRQTLGAADNRRIRDGLTFRKVVKPIINPTTMIRRRVFDALGGYRDYVSEDTDLWLRALDTFSFGRINETLLSYRFNPSGITRSKASLQAAGSCMAAANYTVHRQTGVDLYACQPVLFDRLQDLARAEVERAMPAQEAFRKAKEQRRRSGKVAAYVAVARVVLAHGASALPYFALRRRRALVSRLVEIAISELNLMGRGD